MLFLRSDPFLEMVFEAHDAKRWVCEAVESVHEFLSAGKCEFSGGGFTGSGFDDSGKCTGESGIAFLLALLFGFQLGCDSTSFAFFGGAGTTGYALTVGISELSKPVG